MLDNRQQIVTLLNSFGIKIIGFCDVPAKIEKIEIEEFFPRAVVFGFRLSESVLRTIEDRPTLIYKHHYKTVNWILDQTACHLARYVEDQGMRALALPASQTVDWEKQRGHVSHKTLAVAAGLGHIGRSGLVVHHDFGAQVRYASVLTDMEFTVDAYTEATCGDCKKCMNACPASAIGEAGVDLNLCLNKLKEFSKIRGVGQYICGVCVKVCDGRN
ncbi:MAG: epoxyqueuosine reductase [candidate division WOR-3 bacterium]|nr:MAG: epoxyqueuosine reductase [candidate division WOR-3 bacterium]